MSVLYCHLSQAILLFTIAIDEVEHQNQDYYWQEESKAEDCKDWNQEYSSAHVFQHAFYEMTCFLTF